MPLRSVRALLHQPHSRLAHAMRAAPNPHTLPLAPSAVLCSGLGPSLLGVMHVVIQFPLYESLKARFAARHADGGPHSEKLNL